MRVTFVKRGGRRYGVYVARDRGPDLVAGSIGYDDYLPHDLLHFIAEAEFGLDDGVFGDLAAGGNARLFVPVDRNLVAKTWRKQRIRRTRLVDGRRSEQLAGALERAWEARRRGEPVGDPTLARLMPRLDELAARWHSLQIGGSLTLTWPRPERRRVKQAVRDKRGAPRASAGAAARTGARS